VSKRPKSRIRLAASPNSAAQDEASFEGLFSSAPPWLVSLIIHCALLLVVGLAAAEVRRQTTTEMDVELAPLDDYEEIGDDETFAETIGEQLDVPQPTLDSNPLASEVSTSYSLSDLPPVESPLAAPPLSSNPTALGDGFFSAVEAPSIGWALSGRQEGRKDALLKAYGGTKTTQDSVNLALRWIAAQQGSSGLWSLQGPYADGGGSENQLSATAMALLAFLGDGHTHLKDGPYKRTVARGVRALIKLQGNQGNFDSSDAPDSHLLYTQAQCTIALCELYAITEDSFIREAATKAVNYCVEIQSPEGGWRYAPYVDSDTSVTGWFVMALTSARMAKLDVPEATLDRVGQFLDSVSPDDGATYAYQERRGATPAMTAEALLCRQYLGWPRNEPSLLRGVAMLSKYPINWRRPNVYHWYYATQVMHHMGGPRWTEWNRVMRQRIPAEQVRRGQEKGSWNPDRDQWASTGGRLYMTCLSTYMLEVYYRHLPLYAAPMKGDQDPLSKLEDEAG
jgi:hypothetical protein